MLKFLVRFVSLNLTGSKLFTRSRVTSLPVVGTPAVRQESLLGNTETTM